MKSSTVLLALALAAPASAQEPIGSLDASLADAPLEAALTVAALKQLETLEKGRITHALYQLEALLALPGFRAEAVTEALESHGGLSVLRKVTPAVKAKALKELRDGLEAEVARRIDELGRRSAALVTPVPAGLAENPELVWLSTEHDQQWWRVHATPDRELEVRLSGCDFATLSLFDAAGRKIGGDQLADGFTPARLWAPAEVEQAWVRARRAEVCDGPWQVAMVARQAPVALPSTPPGTQVAVEIDRTYRVRPRGTDGELRFTFPVVAGEVYTVRTQDLEGSADTRLSLQLPGDRPALRDDDGGEGLASVISFDTLLDGTAVGTIRLNRSDSRSAYRLSVSRDFHFDVADPIVLGAAPASMPGAAWNGLVVPVEMEESGTFRFEASAGSVYTFHTALDVELVGPDEMAALRLLGKSRHPSWAVRPLQAFLAIESGSFEARVRRNGHTEATGPIFFQLVLASEKRPTPNRVRLGKTLDSATRMFPMDEDRFDGGVIDDLAPGEEAWVEFPVVPRSLYTIYVDGADTSGALVADLVDASDLEQVLASSESSSPVASFARMSMLDDTWALRVTNRSDDTNLVRIAVISDRAYSGFEVGDRVELGRHRLYGGEENWAKPMERYVGRNAIITEHLGLDASGGWIVRIDIDEGEWVWRTRDMQLVSRSSEP